MTIEEGGFMALTEKNYKPRIIDNSIKKRLGIFGAVCIEGPKWCGKTWSGLNHAESVLYVGDPQGNFQNRILAQLDADLALEGLTPRLIDEWQEVPALWDAIRHAVDKSGKKGQYILTGSATPKRKGILHSGTGRIDRIRMRPMSLYESGDSSGEVSLKALFNNWEETKKAREVGLEEIIYLTVRGGWPGNLKASRSDAGVIPQSYLRSLVEDDFELMPESIRSKKKMVALIKSLGRNTSTLVSNRTLMADIIEFEKEEIGYDTVGYYLDLLERVFIIEKVNAFDPNYRSSTRVAKNPKRIFVDPSIAVAALGLTSEKMLRNLNQFGFIFESMALRDLKIYAEANEGNVFHYKHFDRGDEIDAVVEMPDGKWGAFEIKLGANQIEEAAANLVAMKEYMATRDSTTRVPDVLCVICGLSGIAYKREDGVYVVPLTSLKN